MKRRLLRALQGGGVTAKTRGDTWSVWRSKDRRRRIIGSLPGSHIDLLRLHSCLVSNATTRPETLMWNAALATDMADKSSSSLNNFLIGDGDDCPVLETLILTWRDPNERKNIVVSVLALRQNLSAWQNVEAELSPEDALFLKRLLKSASPRHQFARSEGLLGSQLDRRSSAILRTVARCGPFKKLS